MTTYQPRKVQCAVCGAQQEINLLSSTSCFGPCDFDMRPAPLERYTNGDIVKRCSKCGFTGSDLERKPGVGITKEFLAALDVPEEVMSAGSTAENFYRWHIIAEKEGNRRAAFYSLLRAAWACDDKEAVETAVMLRREAVGAVDALLEELKNLPEPERTVTDEEYDEDDYVDEKETLKAIRLDLLRRSRQFERLLRETVPSDFEDSISRQVAEKQIELAKALDDKCYNLSILR